MMSYRALASHFRLLFSLKIQDVLEMTRTAKLYWVEEILLQRQHPMNPNRICDIDQFCTPSNFINIVHHFVENGNAPLPFSVQEG